MYSVYSYLEQALPRTWRHPSAPGPSQRLLAHCRDLKRREQLIKQALANTVFIWTLTFASFYRFSQRSYQLSHVTLVTRKHLQEKHSWGRSMIYTTAISHYLAQTSSIAITFFLILGMDSWNRDCAGASMSSSASLTKFSTYWASGVPKTAIVPW